MSDLEKYKELNNSFKNRNLIFHMGYDAGFYSEFNNMVLAIIYCLEKHIRFSMYSADANFKYKDGWQDYFLPFCKEVKDPFHHKYNARMEDPWFTIHGSKLQEYLEWRLKHRYTYLTFDVFNEFRLASFERGRFTVPELGLDGDLRSVAKHIINRVYRFNEKTDNEIHDRIIPLNLPEKYVGFHIRGGDKFVEHTLEQCSAYILKSEQLSSLRDAFVMTDDYSIIETLQHDYPDWRFYTLTNPAERGYFHSDFQRKNGNEKKDDLIKLFASMEVLRASDLFIGTFSSNPGMFLGMCMDRAYGIDYDHWILW